MNHELITHVPINKVENDFDGEVSVRSQSAEQHLGAVALIETVPVIDVGGTFVIPGTALNETANRTVPIEDQTRVTVTPETVPGHPAYEARQEAIANEMRSNTR